MNINYTYKINNSIISNIICSENIYIYISVVIRTRTSDPDFRL